MSTFRALDQYNTACSTLSDLIHRRNNELVELNSLIGAVSGPGNYGNIVMSFDLVRATELVGELSQIEEAINGMVVEVNRHAEKCGRPKLRKFA